MYHRLTLAGIAAFFGGSLGWSLHRMRGDTFGDVDIEKIRREYQVRIHSLTMCEDHSHS
jgi:hypothetical protein